MEGISLNNLLAEFNLSDTALADVCQHEQQVIEIAAQLMEVCKLHCIFDQVYWSMPDLTNMSFADSAVPTYQQSCSSRYYKQQHYAAQGRIQCLGSTEAA